MILSTIKSPRRVLLSLILITAGSYFTPVVAYSPFQGYGDLKNAVDQYCAGTFDPTGSGFG